MRYVHRAVSTLVLAALFCMQALGGPAEASAQEPDSPAAPRVTIWDGIYTTEQAIRGERTAYRNCFTCHVPADWTNSRFLDSSSDQKLGDLFQTISRAMPMDAPGKLSPQEYADIVAYMLERLGAPTGETELPSELRELDRIFVARPVPLP